MVRARSLEVGEEVDRPPVAPCAERCPLYLCIQGYAAHIAAGRYADALELIMSDLPLPDSVCRVCHRPCESVVRPRRRREPVAINDLKRFVLDWAALAGGVPLQPGARRRRTATASPSSAPGRPGSLRRTSCASAATRSTSTTRTKSRAGCS